MKWLELTILLSVGFLFCYLGWKIWKKEQMNLIHDYHYTKVKDSDKKAYTAKIGKALLLIGAGAIVTGILDFTATLQYSWLPFGICLCAGLIMIVYAQVKYNHGIF